jgi:hypothetical protein
MSDEIGRERWARHEAVSDFPPTRAFARPLGVHVAQRVCRKDRWRLHGFVFGLPFGYLFGLPIVLVMWVEDWFLSDKIGLRMKVATSACVGYVASIAMLLLTSALHLQLPQILSFGIVGAIPAAVCSWLAGTTENRGTSRQ